MLSARSTTRTTTRTTVLRRASHAGSWYDADARALGAKLDAWLDAAEAAGVERRPRAAIICPHAGYSYSGSTAAFSYASVDVRHVTRVWVLGPSHHVAIPGRVAVSPCTAIEVPLGAPLQVDTDAIAALRGLPNFTSFSVEDDEAEHSLEMQFPYIWKIFQRAGKSPADVRLVPLVVGSLDERREAEFGALIAERALADPHALVVVSSDFCHWGSRFAYQYVCDASLPIHEAISRTDHEGMDLISRLDHAGFAQYLKRTRNTICGRHPIGVCLGAVTNAARANGHDDPTADFEAEFLHYRQSSACVSRSDSSVSYAAGVVTPRS